MKRVQTLLSAAVISAACGYGSVVHAAAGDDITNIATIDYSVAGVDQEDIESSPYGNATPGAGEGADTIFVEDQIINFFVQTNDTVEVDVAPLANTNVAIPDRYLTYTIYNVASGDGSGITSNFSNGTITLTVATNDLANGTANPFSTPNGDATDEFTSTDCKIYEDTTSGTELTSITLAPATSQTVYVACDIPAELGGNDVNGNLVNNDITVVNLIATASQDFAGNAIATLDNSSVNGNLTVEYVFADAQGTDDAAAFDGEHSDRSAYRIFKADLTATKTVTIVSDPVCTADPSCTNPKMIPGAIVEYTIEVGNDAGAATATDVTISDTLVAADVAYQAGSLVGNNTDAAGTATPDDSGDPTLAVTCDTLAGGEVCTMTFQAEVQY